jgi:hypothetical protein
MRDAQAAIDFISVLLQDDHWHWPGGGLAWVGDGGVPIAMVSMPSECEPIEIAVKSDGVTATERRMLRKIVSYANDAGLIVHQVASAQLRRRV